MRLQSNRRETPSTRTIRVALDGRNFPYAAGQAAWVGLAPDDELTPYSIASAPEETARDGSLQFLVKVDEARRFGAAVATLRRGADIFVAGPFGSFVFPARPPRAPLLFVAGGTGIAPIRAMIVHALAAGATEPIRLLYSGRSPDEFAYLDELRALAREGRLSLELTLTGDAGRWRHSRGRASAAHLERLAGSGTIAFLCGPPSMVADVSATLTTLGVRADDIRREQWER